MDSRNRATSVKFKLMPDGHIRGVQTHRKDLASASEWYIYSPKGIAPTVRTKGGEHMKVMKTDERISKSLQEAAKGL